MDGLVVVVALIAVGALLRWTRAFSPEAPRVLSKFVICVSLPALILVRVPGLVIPAGATALIVTPWAMIFVSAALVLLAARACRWDRPTTGAMLLIVPLGNTSFLGLPMVSAVLGDASVSYALLYDQLGTFLGLAIYGSIVLAAYSDAAKATVPGIARRVATFPPFVAVVAAFALRGVPLHPGLHAVLNAAASTLVPVIMVAVGLMLDLRVGRRGAAVVSIALVLKMAVAPAAAWTLCRVIGVPPDVARVSVFEAAMPPMITAGALAASNGLAPRLASSSVGVGILLSLVTLPLLGSWL